ncbi:hypothetical protein EBR21_07215, partial [bacterium]|nr:hypothetical protein [bacterium]
EATIPASGTLIAATSNFALSNLTLKGYKNGTQITSLYSSTLPINFTTTALTAPDGTAFTSTPSTTCAFANGACGTTFNFTFGKADTNARSLTVNVNGVSTVTGTNNGVLNTITVAEGRASSTKTTFTLLDASNNVKVGTTVPASDTIGLNIALKDAFGNATDRNNGDDNTCATTNSSIIAQTTVLPNGNADNTTKYIAPATNARETNVTGSYLIRGMRLTGPGANTLTITTCGVPYTLNVNITAGVASKFYLNRQSTASKTNLDDDQCSLLSGGGANCNTINAWFFDAYGNNRANDTCDSWELTSLSSGNGLTVPWNTLAQTSISVKVVHSSALDANLTCVKAGATEDGTAGITLYGGVKSIEASIPSSGTLGAGNSNFSISNIQLKSYKNGSAINAAYSGSLPINFTTNALTGLDGTAFTTSPSVSCTFSSSGLCTTTYAFSFVKADTTQRWLGINVNGVSSVTGTNSGVLNTITVSEGVASATKTTFTLLDASNNVKVGNTVPASDTIGLNIALKDDFGNATDKKTDGTVCAANTSQGASTITQPAAGATIGGLSANPANGDGFTNNEYTPPTTNAWASAGNYQIRGMRLTGPGANALKITTCGVDYVLSVNVTAGLVAKYRLNSNNASDASISAVACDTVYGGGISCPTIYAWFYDAYYNLRSGDTCDSWTMTNQSTTGTGNTTIPTITSTVSDSFKVTHTSAMNGRLNCVKTSNSIAGGAVDRDGSSGITLYGGIKYIEVTVTQTSGAVTAGANNITITGIQLKHYRGSSNTLENSDNYSALNLPIEFSTNASTGLDGTAFTTTPNVNCTLDSTGKCATTYNFSFVHADSTARTLSIKVNGVTASIIGGTNSSVLSNIVVSEGNPSQFTTTLASTLAADATTSGTISLMDAYRNPACTTAMTMASSDVNNLLNSANASYAVSPNGTNPQINGTTLASNTAVTINNTSKGTYTVGTTSLPRVNSTGVGLNLSACGYNFTHNIKTTVGAANDIKLLLSNNQTDAQVQAASTSGLVSSCIHSTLSGNGVSCVPIYAYFRDNKGNLISDSNTICTWVYTTVGTAPSPAGSMPSRAITISHSKFIDGNIKCQLTQSGTTSATYSNTVAVRGGVSKVDLELATSTTTGIVDTSSNEERGVTAANSNVGIWKIKLYSRVNGTDTQISSLTNPSDYSFATEPIDFVTTSLKGGGAANSVTPASPTCNFSNGLCNNSGLTFATIPASNTLSLTRSGASGTNDVAVKIRGVTSNT